MVVEADPTPVQKTEEPAPAAEKDAPAVPVDAQMTRMATVLEVAQAPNYTYARMDACGQEAWVAGPKMELEVGQHVELKGSNVMKNLRSDHLDRTFESLLMADLWKITEEKPKCEAMLSEPLRFGTIRKVESPGQYTFVLLDVCGEEVWITGPETPDLAPGDIIGTPIGFKQTDFRVNALNMRFDKLFMVDWIKRAKALPPCQ